MPEIKVVGDIRSGKYQPTLTGNAIVDAALIDHFCQQLATALQLPGQRVQAEHHWNLTIDAQTIYIIDSRIWRASATPGDHQNVIPVSGIDLQRGRITTAYRRLLHLLPHQTTSNL
ncbi:hypothetical protein [Levilactobacillus acidifarinae]|uniref:Uncharacterized protein n=1 Tax=Levilactobacillus acidifarinae DSM 19394 = JCM 15949 TaxID=1423715 RepID=A0A0R1LTV0_9LACO|nr:hypothetical protein [Levilactobacillus acidifarinae]KRK94903.1 hypothetical protein FD25_GL000882 [Levilactobacillus acidifarinae DSM 19394]GEO70304.1 hypothetical protein LAC03_22140 [Levilactobacillus acidifarinae]